MATKAQPSKATTSPYESYSSLAWHKDRSRGSARNAWIGRR